MFFAVTSQVGVSHTLLWALNSSYWDKLINPCHAKRNNVSNFVHDPQLYYSTVVVQLWMITWCIVCCVARTPSRQAVALAMNNVNKYFPVVGYVEEFEDFLRVLEQLFPQYFKGVYRLFTRSKGNVYLCVMCVQSMTVRLVYDRNLDCESGTLCMHLLVHIKLMITCMGDVFF